MGNGLFQPTGYAAASIVIWAAVIAGLDRPRASHRPGREAGGRGRPLSRWNGDSCGHLGRLGNGSGACLRGGRQGLFLSRPVHAGRVHREQGRARRMARGPDGGTHRGDRHRRLLISAAGHARQRHERHPECGGQALLPGGLLERRGGAAGRDRHPARIRRSPCALARLARGRHRRDSHRHPRAVADALARWRRCSRGRLGGPGRSNARARSRPSADQDRHRHGGGGDPDRRVRALQPPDERRRRLREAFGR